MKLKDALKIQKDMDKLMTFVSKVASALPANSKDVADCLAKSLCGDVIKANGKSDKIVDLLKAK